MCVVCDVCVYVMCVVCVRGVCAWCVCVVCVLCVGDRSFGEENLGLNPVLLKSHFRCPKILTTCWRTDIRYSKPIQNTVHLSLLPNLCECLYCLLLVT